KLAAPAKRVRSDVGEAPPQLRVVLVADEHDPVACGPADEPTHTAVHWFYPRGPPGADRVVVEADRRTVKGQRRLALSRLTVAGHDPDVLDRAAAEHPAGVQLSGHHNCVAVGVAPGPLERPGTDELSEQAQLVDVRSDRAGHVQRLDKPVAGARWIGL